MTPNDKVNHRSYMKTSRQDRNPKVNKRFDSNNLEISLRIFRRLRSAQTALHMYIVLFNSFPMWHDLKNEAKNDYPDNMIPSIANLLYRKKKYLLEDLDRR